MPDHAITFRDPEDLINWAETITAAIRRAGPGDTITVPTPAMRTLAEAAAARMGKTGITFKTTENPRA
jgi:hypothetical protein